MADGRTRIIVDKKQLDRFRRLLSERMDPRKVAAASVGTLAEIGWDLACIALEGTMDGETAPVGPMVFGKDTAAELADLRSHCAHLEDVAGALQVRLAALEEVMGRVLTLAAAVDSSGRTNVAQELARRARMEEVRKARAAESAPRGDRSDAGDVGRLTPCREVDVGLVGATGQCEGIGEVV